MKKERQRNVNLENEWQLMSLEIDMMPVVFLLLPAKYNISVEKWVRWPVQSKLIYSLLLWYIRSFLCHFATYTSFYKGVYHILAFSDNGGFLISFSSG